MVLQLHHSPNQPTDLDQPIATRRAPRPHRLPKRYRDILPEPLPSLPPVLPAVDTPCTSRQQTLGLDAIDSSHPECAPDDTPVSAGPSLSSRLFRYIHTLRNIFGLLREFFAEHLPAKDPDELASLADLCNMPVISSAADSESAHATPPVPLPSTCYPYPNESSFLLGDWFWNGGVQKSKKDFKDLVDIITHPRFKPDDIRHTRWKNIDDVLGSNEAEDEQWIDVMGAGWNTAQVKISVPFHRRTPNPGPKQYIGANLYYRSLVDVIKEKLQNPQDFERFHLEPYQLIWKPPHYDQEVNVHGELYTSRAFLDAHRELQASSGEPGCDLPRVVVALMFWSDSTQLTSFGNAKLWPVYLFFGNESKYRRCKPSCNLCNHVAYFEDVWTSALLLTIVVDIPWTSVAQ
jgi:hypothetical protein